MNKKLIFLILFSFETQAAEALPVSAVSEIQTIDSFDQAKNILDSADENTYVFFDLDETLIKNVNNICKPKFENYLAILTRKHHAFYQSLSNIEQNEVYNQKDQKVLIEPNIIDIIKNLKQKHVNIFGLTTRHSTDWMTNYVYNVLKKLGIDFTHDLFSDCDIPVYVGKPQNQKLYKGIIFTNATCKGDPVISFLDKKNILPGRIIFFDNVYQNIIDLQTAINKYNRDYLPNNIHIDFYGFHYTAFDKEEVPSLQEVLRIAEYQFQHLSDTGIWPSEAYAREMLSLLAIENDI